MEGHICISVDHVNKSFGKNQVLDDISLHVYSSGIFGLLGPSGAGKTTLIKLIVGIAVPTSGTVSVLGTKMPNFDVMKKLGFMAQSDALYGELSAKENLEFFGAIYGLGGTKLKSRMEKVAKLVHLTEDLKKTVNQYSGGMKRRLSLAASLLHEPEILVLDEPTVGIDPVLRKSIWNELKSLSQNGTTVIVTTHAMDEAEKCQRLGMIRNGKLIASGSPTELKEQTSTETIEEAFLHFGGAYHEN